MDEQLREYRTWIIRAEQRAQEDFDKTVLSLSGGGLGVSFAFVKDVVGPHPLRSSGLLVASWLAWALSSTCVLASFFFSQLALRRTINQIDAEEIYDRDPGGIFSSLTRCLNALGALLFLAGVVLIVIFVSENLR